METNQPTANQAPTDRDLLIGLYNLVGALAEKLTGERPTARVPCGEDGFVSTTPSTYSVTWRRPAAPGG